MTEPDRPARQRHELHLQLERLKLSQTQTRTDSSGTDTLLTSYAYDPDGMLLTTTFPDGTDAFEHVHRDGEGRDDAWTSSGGRRATRTTPSIVSSRPRAPTAPPSSQTYDAENERTSSTDPAGFTTSYQYDGDSRLTVTTHPDSTYTTTTYDLSGRAIAVTDEAGFTTSTGYDADGRVTSQSDALGNATGYVYDAAGNQTQSTDPLHHTTTTRYDADNRRVGTTYPDGTSDAVAYDAAGRMIAKTDQLGRIDRLRLRRGCALAHGDRRARRRHDLRVRPDRRTHLANGRERPRHEASRTTRGGGRLRARSPTTPSKP